jgi:hypothetical protein
LTTTPMLSSLSHLRPTSTLSLNKPLSSALRTPRSTTKL